MDLKKKVLIGAGVVVLIVMIAVSTILFKNVNNVIEVAKNYKFTVVAENDTNAGIDVGTGFYISSNEDYPVDELEKVIKISPTVDFDITKKGSGNYYLKPKVALADNTVYNIYTESEEEPGLSWAFQTKADFKVTSTLPADERTGVPINTGIEMYFSKVPTDMSGFFTISPKVNGKFEIIGKKVCFIPSESLTYSTKYEITISPNYKAIDGTELGKDYIYSFTTSKEYTGNSGTQLYLLNEDNISYSTKETPIIDIGGTSYTDWRNETFFVDVYNVGMPEQYIEQVSDKISIEGLKSALHFETKLIDENESDYDYSRMIVFPEPLPAGYYVVDIKTGEGVGKLKNQHMQLCLQITDIVTYVQSGSGSTVIWCNDSVTGAPVANATVKLDTMSAKTNENGVAIFYYTPGKCVPLYVTSTDGKRFAEYIYLEDKEEETLNDLYYTYFYTDREVYLPTDKINFWGVILPKKSSAVAPKTVDIAFSDIATQKVNINSDGTFVGNFEFSKIVSNYYDIDMKINDKEIFMKSIEITEYTKPTYILSASFDKKYYKEGETAKTTITGTFYDGTPADGLEVSVYSNGESKDVTLDKFGTKEVTRVLQNSAFRYPATSWHPTTIWQEISTTGDDENNAWTECYATFFPSNYMFEADWVNNEITLSTNSINFGKWDEYTYGNYDKLKGAGSTATGTIKVIKHESIREEAGEYYDYINRVNRKKYNYRTETTTIDTIPFTVNGETKITTTYPDEKNVWYTAELEYTLKDGFKGKTTLYNWFKYDSAYYDDDDYYYGDYYSLSTENDEWTYSVKDEVKLFLNKKGNRITNDGKILYTLYNDTLLESAVTNKDEISFTFKEEYVPDIGVAGAYFDGKNVYALSDRHVYFEYNDRSLDITISTDKEAYNPGDTVNMTVEAKDKSGKYAKTKLIMSVVDEAAFAIRNQEVYVLSRLYSYDYHSVTQYVSNVIRRNYTTAEAGGEGGDEGYRSDFADTAAFINITTGSNGKTTASFKLPDNLTSWRITAVGITDNIRAGSATKNITCGLPFFVNQVINTKYAKDDDVVFTARIAGSDKKNVPDDVKYVAKISGNGKDQEIELTKNKNDIAVFNFGKLPEGTYDVSVKVAAGNYTDGIKKPITVLSSLHEIPIVSDVNLSKALDIEAARFPVTLTFYNEENGLYYDNISKILATSWGRTNDQKIARNLVYERFNTFAGEDIYEIEEFNDIQSYTGGAQILSYADADVLFTAKLCAIAPEYLDAKEAKYYFNNILAKKDATSEEVSAAYFGLAALKEPVLNDINYLLTNNSGFTMRDNINLISGLAYIGDINGATQWYVKLLSGSVKGNSGSRYIQIGNNDENYEATSSLLIALIKCNNTDMKDFLRYVIDNKSDKYTPALDLASYLKVFNPKTDHKGTLEYKLNGEKENVDFSGKRFYRLVLNENDLNSFKVTAHSGVKCKAFYFGNLTDVVDENKISIKKSISGGRNVGDEVTVTINVKFPANSENARYLISDVVPTGMRFTHTNGSSYSSNNWYLLNKEGQKLYFEVYKNNYKNSNEATITYTVRNLLPGSYYVDSAVAENYEDNSHGYSTAGSYEIYER
ncbi:MAG: Ig-like domain-containing protein [Clostridia bacterium]|nr:Ig-like domain-containing protein [Clostridia bacterium]